MRSLPCLLALAAVASPSPLLAVEAMQLHCQMTTLGAARSVETPSDFVFRVEPGPPAKLKLVSLTKKFDGAAYVLDSELDLTETDYGFAATSNGVEGISFTSTTAGKYDVSWMGCDHEATRSGEPFLTHCGFNSGGEGTCSTEPESKGSA